MRPLFRTSAVALASALLLYFGSCERHKPSELHHGEHAAGDPTEHTANVPAIHEQEVPAGKVHQSASQVSPTPAQFFPAATPTP